MECEVCGAEIKKGVMGKIKGTYVKHGGKLKAVCPNCQKLGEEKAKEKLGGKL